MSRKRSRRKLHRTRSLIRYFLLLFCLSYFIVMLPKPVQAGGSVPSPEDINYTEIQAVIDDIMTREQGIDFGDYVGKLVSGQESFSFAGIGQQLMDSVNKEIKANASTLGKLISIAIISALFTNLSMALKNNQVSETGYYVTYLLLFGLLISSFWTASVIASTVIKRILDFMKALVPTYYMAVGFCTGTATAMAFYQMALVIISMVDLIILKIVIPMINFYLLITLANNLSREDMLSKLAGLLETIVKWLLKSLLAAVVGFQAIQGLIIPVSDQMKRSMLYKASKALPAIGNTVGVVAETVLSAGALLKNAIGVAGLVVILVICVIPVIKLLIIALIYRGASAALQPISDKRIIECISVSAKSAEMLLNSVFVGTVLFLLSITIVAVSTGGVK